MGKFSQFIRVVGQWRANRVPNARLRQLCGVMKEVDNRTPERVYVRSGRLTAENVD